MDIQIDARWLHHLTYMSNRPSWLYIHTWMALPKSFTLSSMRNSLLQFLHAIYIISLIGSFLSNTNMLLWSSVSGSVFVWSCSPKTIVGGWITNGSWVYFLLLFLHPFIIFLHFYQYIVWFSFLYLLYLPCFILINMSLTS